MHAIVAANVPHRGWPAVQETLKSKHRIRTHCVVGSGQGVDHLRKALEYLLAPSDSKWVLCKEPFFSSNFPLPSAVIESQRKAASRIRSKMASRDDVQKVVNAWSFVQDADDFTDTADSKLAAVLKVIGQPGFPYAGLDIPLVRLQKFCSANLAQMGSIVNPMIDRRDRAVYADLRGKPFAFFFETALGAQCCCKNEVNLSSLPTWAPAPHPTLCRRPDPPRPLPVPFRLHLLTPSPARRLLPHLPRRSCRPGPVMSLCAVLCEIGRAEERCHLVVGIPR